MDGFFYLIATMRGMEEKLENNSFFGILQPSPIWEGTSQFYEPCPARVIFYQITCCGYLEIY